LAKVKGIIITAIIAVGIIGASMLIWFIPPSSQQQGKLNGINITDKEGAAADVANLPADNLSFVYTQHNFARTEVENSFDKWTKGQISSSDMNAAISSARSELDSLKKRVDTPGVPQPWQQAYSTYSQALGKFGSYLDEMKRLVDNNSNSSNGTSTSSSTAVDHSNLDSIKAEMDSLVNKAIKEFPTS
jgi:hypothetical protein